MCNRNPYHPIRINPHLFYGADRQEMIFEIVSGLKRGESFAVVGGRRLGKTTLLRRLKLEIEHTAPNILPIYVDVQALPYVYSALEVFDWLKYQVIAQVGITLEGSIQSYPPRWIVEILNRTGYHKIVLIVDEFDAFRSYPWSDTLFNNFRALIQNMPGISDKFGIVVAGARTMDVLHEGFGSPLANVLTWRYLSVLLKEDALRLICEPVNEQFPATISTRVWEMSGGHPYIIQFIMYHLCENYGQGHLENILEHIEEKFVGENEILLKQLWFDHLEEPERRVFRALQHEGAMTLDALITRLGIKRGVVQKYLKILSFVGVVRKEGDLYTPAGSLLDRWIKENDFETDPGMDSTTSCTLRDLLEETEKAIRKFVVIQLENMGEAENIPKIFSEEIARARERYAKERSADGDVPLMELFAFTDFAFPFKVVERFWKGFFWSFHENARVKILGKDPNKAKLRFEERYETLVRVRNAIAHSRPVEELEQDKARVYSREILALVSSVESTTTRVANSSTILLKDLAC
ncbi:MAG: AAA family ATPase [Nitrososphaerota archaeon]